MANKATQLVILHSIFASDGHKIDGLALIMVAAEVSCVHWIRYIVSYIVECTAEDLGQGGGVSVESNPNL